jgi:hypothetical protein
MWPFDLNAMEGKMGPNTTFLAEDISYLDSIAHLMLKLTNKHYKSMFLNFKS